MVIRKEGDEVSTELSARTSVSRFMEPTNISASVLSAKMDDGTHKSAGPALVVEGETWEMGGIPGDSDNEVMSVAVLITSPEEALGLSINALCMILTEDQMEQLAPILNAMVRDTVEKEAAPSLFSNYQASIDSRDIELLYREASGIDDE